MKLSMGQAAKATGKSKATMHRAIKSGRLSADRQEDGSYLIDPSELARVFPVVSRNRSVETDVRQDETPNETAALRTEIDLLRERLAGLENDKADLRAERDRLLKVVEEQATGLRLLTDQREEKARRTWWQRLRGR